MTVAAPTIRGRRVTLRPYAAGFTDAEVDRIHAWSRDDELLDLAGGTRVTLPPQQFRRAFLRRARHRNGEREQQFAILDDRGRLIGRTGLYGLDPRSASAELGILVGQKDCWGRGYGRDAVSALCRHGFADLGLKRIVLYTYPHNVRAQRAFAAVGFRAVRKLRRFSLERGIHVQLEMDLLPSRLRLCPGAAAPADGSAVAPQRTARLPAVGK